MADNQPHGRQQQPSFPRILSNRANTRYVELSTHYSDHADWYDAIQRLEASFNGETITLCQLQSEELPIKLTLNAQAMGRLIIGYLNYLTDQGMIITGPVADNPSSRRLRPMFMPARWEDFSPLPVSLRQQTTTLAIWMKRPSKEQNERKTMSVQRDFQRDLQKARPKAAQLAQALRELGILHKAIDVERAGILALVETPDGIPLDDMISLGNKNEEERFKDVQHSPATAVARQVLGITPGGHMNYITEVIPPVKSTAGWLVEIPFDGDERHYALPGEYIVPDADVPLSWKRWYRLYQAKTNRTCDVPGCDALYGECKETGYGYLVHVCRHHQAENSDRLYACLYPAQAHGGRILDDVVTPYLELDCQDIKRDATTFAEALAAYLSDQSHPTGLKVYNLRSQSPSLRMDFERIDKQIEIIENRRRREGSG